MIETGFALKDAILERARELGFEKVGFAPARLAEHDRHLEEWLSRGFHGEMGWMEREPSRRTDVSRSLEATETLVCCALGYYQGPKSPGPLRGVISSYAAGEDYHRVLSRKLEELSRFIEERADVPTKYYVDTGPVLEKAYAAAAGIGWLGKHANLLARDASSWFFLGEILVPLEIPYDEPEPAHCGTCTRCIEACPTRAIVEPYVVDSRLCISYLTIELRGPIARELRPLIGDRIYGCDDCQDVCPWNRFARKSAEEAFFAREPLASMDLVQMMDMSREAFIDATRHSAIRRARYAGFLRNVAVALGNSGDPGALPALIRALDHDEPLVRGHAAWALGHLGYTDGEAPLRGRLAVEPDPTVIEEIQWALDRGGARSDERPQ